MIALEKDNNTQASGENNTCLHQKTPPVCHGQILGILCSSRYYVFEGTGVQNLADELTAKEHISAVAVLNANHEITGIIPRKRLFDTLGRPYGRDLNKNKNVERFADEVMVLHYRTNIYSLPESQKHDLSWQNNYYYCLSDDDDIFVGIISDWDILKHLSHITKKDVDLASKLQSCIVKDQIKFSTNNFDILGSARMAKGVGGDFYLIKNISKDKSICVICDVSGKGIAASLLSVTLGGMLEMYDFSQGVQGLIEKMNSFFFNTFGGDQFITALFVEFDNYDSRIMLYSLGHAYIFLKRKNRIFRVTLKKGTIPLGIQPKLKIEAVPMSCSKDDLIIVSTDGLDEQRNATGEQYGDGQLMKALNSYGEMSLEQLEKKIVTDLDYYRGTQPQQDDITLMFIKCKK